MPTSRSEPPPLAGSKSRWFGSNGTEKLKSLSIEMIRPNSPASSRCLSATCSGLKRIHIASIRKRFVSRDVAIIEVASATSIAIGFSTRTCFPARIIAMAWSWCTGWMPAT